MTPPTTPLRERAPLALLSSGGNLLSAWKYKIFSDCQPPNPLVIGGDFVEPDSLRRGLSTIPDPIFLNAENLRDSGMIVSTGHGRAARWKRQKQD